MGNFSRNTFDPKKHYVGVRLQQGVPLVDADWNEMEDIRRHEFESLVKSVVGDGVPADGDGFRIEAKDPPSADDFVIKAGVCFVQGWMVENEIDRNYSQQTPSPENLPSLQPHRGRTDTAYLDVWEVEIDSKKDDSLINKDIGIETCVRRKRCWAVRVVQDTGSPEPNKQGHAYCALATLRRSEGQPIEADCITDLRRTGLSVLSSVTSFEQRLQAMEARQKPRFYQRYLEQDVRRKERHEFDPIEGRPDREVRIFFVSQGVDIPSVFFGEEPAAFGGDVKPLSTPVFTELMVKVPQMPPSKVRIKVMQDDGSYQSTEQFTVTS